MTEHRRARHIATAVVAEDEPLLRMESADTLTDAGFVVPEGSSAAEALDRLSAWPNAALLVTDVYAVRGR